MLNCPEVAPALPEMSLATRCWSSPTLPAKAIASAATVTWTKARKFATYNCR